MKEIYLTRHGSTVWNLEKRLQGSGDSELTEGGLNQAKELGKRINDLSINKIYTSPIKRAYRTANIIKGDNNIAVIAYDELREMNFGEYEGYIEKELLNEGRGKEIQRVFNGELDVRIPGGETLREVYNRVKIILDKIIEEDNDTILIVAHGITLKAMLCYFQKTLEFPNFIMGQATLTKILVDDNKNFIIEYMNDDSHLVNNKCKVGW